VTLNKRYTRYFADLALWLLATPIAFYLRLDNEFSQHLRGLQWLIVIGFPLKVFVIWWAGFHRRSWQKVGMRDLMVVIRAIAAVTLILTITAITIQKEGILIPRSAPIIEGMFTILALSGMRMFSRLLSERHRRRKNQENSSRVLVIGAGDAGTLIAREMLRHPEACLIPVGFLDDDVTKKRDQFLGLRVLGKVDDFVRVCADHQIDEVLIAMPSVRGDVVRHIIKLAKTTDVKHRIMPGLYDLLSGKVSISQIRPVDVEDLLRRDPVRLNNDEIKHYIADEIVMVTGAGGSIGSEIVRQIAQFDPKRIVLVGRGENSVYNISQEMLERFPDLAMVNLIADVRDQARVQNIIETHRPSAIFHAAAHKHVPLMEQNPSEAIKNNVLGTRNLTRAALDVGVRRFVNISTDKAVDPSNFMGASKRAAEMVVESAALRAAAGQVFVSVRFGNVLGSRGSVIPLFKRQILAGGPLTITHRDMLRYFMTIPEAAQLVLQAGAFGDNGLLYVLDMGEPVRIMDLAEDLISLSGLSPHDDIEIQETGIRPGEKLTEELFNKEESASRTKHSKIFVAEKEKLNIETFDQRLEKLFEAAARSDDNQIADLLKAIIPTFSHASFVGNGSKTQSRIVENR